jgi:hypothetical protein
MKKNGTASPKSAERYKKFPIRCVECGQVEVRPAMIPFEIEKNQDGKLYQLHIPRLHANRCDNCGEIYLGSEADAQISAALRDEIGLLTPEQIRGNLATLKLNQKDAAEQLGIAPETMSRWLTGAMIQSRAMDNLLRVFFGCTEVREHLSGANQDRNFGTSIVSGTTARRARGVKT